MANIILVVAPHPDDETLGCGGSLLRHHALGDQIYWLIMTTISEKVGYSKKQINARSQEINEVSVKYKFSDVYQAKFASSTLDAIPNNELINEVASFIRKVKPDTIYIPYRNDIHSDHKAAFDAVASCSKSFRYPFIRRIRVYETLSETEFAIRTDDRGFRPNLWIDISKYLEEKIEIMRLYKSEMDDHPFPRSEKNIRALATYRGATVGLDAAEAFISIKEIM